MPDEPTELDGYLDSEGLFHVPNDPAEEAVLKELGYKKWTLPVDYLEKDPDGGLFDYTDDPTKVYRATLVPPSATGTDLNSALLEQATAQVQAIGEIAGMNDNLQKLTGEKNATDHLTGSLQDAEQFRRTQRPLARTAATAGYGPGQFARLTREAGLDYDLNRALVDNGYSYAQSTLAQQQEASRVNRQQDQLNVLGELVTTPTQRQLLLEQMLKV